MAPSALQSTSPTFTGATFGTQVIVNVTGGLVEQRRDWDRIDELVGQHHWSWGQHVDGAYAWGWRFHVQGLVQGYSERNGHDRVHCREQRQGCPTFSCFNSTTGAPANCVNFTYACVGQ